MATQTAKRTLSWLVPGTLLLFLRRGFLLAGHRRSDLSNPHANFWRVVRQGIPGFTTVSSEGHKVLITNSGENWREIRNGLIMQGFPMGPAPGASGHGYFLSLSWARTNWRNPGPG